MKSIYLNKKEVARKFNKSLSTISRWAKTGDFPKPFLFGSNKVVWDLREIENYINEQKKKRGFWGHKPQKKA